MPGVPGGDEAAPSHAIAFASKTMAGDRAQLPCFTKLNGTLMLEPFAPGGSNFARRATPAMQLATEAERPVLLEGEAESTSPLGATLMRITSLPAWVGSCSRPRW